MEIDATPHAPPADPQHHPQLDGPIPSPIRLAPPPVLPAPLRPDEPVDRLAVALIVTPVVGGIRAMRWTSPVTGSCFTLWETGAYGVSRRSRDGRETAAAGQLDDVDTDTCLGAPQGLQARRRAAGFVLDADDRAATSRPVLAPPLPAAS